MNLRILCFYTDTPILEIPKLLFITITDLMKSNNFPPTDVELEFRSQTRPQVCISSPYEEPNTH